MADRSEKRFSLAEERRKLSERQGTIDDIHQTYSKFGSRVVQTVLVYASRSGGLRDLVAKLPVNVPIQNVQGAHDAIVRHIHEYGVASFLSLASLAPMERGVSPVPAPGPSALPPVPAPLPHGPHNPGGEWVWESRRSGKDRRTGQDRRHKVDVISRNRRYGGGRRSKTPRRRRDVPPPWREALGG